MAFKSQIKKIISVSCSRGFVPNLIRIVLTILFLIIVNRSITIQEICDLLLMADPGILLICSGLSAVSILLQAYRWLLVLHAYDLRCDFMVAMKTLLWGNVLAFITPGRAGELFRGIELCSSEKIHMVYASATDRFISIATTIIFSIPAILILNMYFNQTPPAYFMVLIIVGILSLISIFLVLAYPNSVKFFPASVYGGFIYIAKSIKKLNLFNTMLFSFCIHCILILQTSLLFNVFGMEKWFENCVVSLLAYAFMLCVPVSIANIGIREYAFALFAALTYLNPSGSLSTTTASFGVSSVILLLNIIAPALSGLIWNLISYRNNNLNEIMNSELYNSSKKKVDNNDTGQI